MNQEKNQMRFWSGVRCRNPDCGKDLPVIVDSNPVAIQVDLPASKETLMHACSELADKLSVLFNTMATLQGARTSQSGDVDISPMLQHCPYCRRFYLYSYPDFFLTMEDMPEMPE